MLCKEAIILNKKYLNASIQKSYYIPYKLYADDTRLSHKPAANGLCVSCSAVYTYVPILSVKIVSPHCFQGVADILWSQTHSHS